MTKETQAVTQGSGTDAAQQVTADPTPTVQPVPQAAAPVQAPPASQPSVSSQDDVYAPDGKLWKDKFWGAQGALKQTQQQKEEATGGYEQQLLALAQTVKERDAAIATLNQQVEQLRDQIGTIPGLQDNINELTQKATMAERYQLLFEFPQVHNLWIEQTVQGEDGAEPTTQRVNPVLQLVETSQMPMDQLRTTLQQFVASLPTAASPGEDRSPVTSPAIPTPTTPQTSADSDAWTRITAAQDALNNSPGDPAAIKEHQDAWDAYRELDTQPA
jgi:hypothetical protein